MKKKAFLVLLASALLVTGCGKDDEKKDEKKSDKNTNVSVLKCSAEEDGQKVTMTIEQNKKTYEITKNWQLAVMRHRTQQSVRQFSPCRDDHP